MSFSGGRGGGHLNFQDRFSIVSFARLLISIFKSMQPIPIELCSVNMKWKWNGGTDIENVCEQ